MKFIKTLINKFLKLFNLTIIRSSSLNKLNLEILKEPIIEQEYKDLIKKIEIVYGQNYSSHSLYTVYTLCRYLHSNKIEGDIIECGVYQGVCIAMILAYFSSKNDFSRDIYLYDTFEGMTKPSQLDYYFLNSKKLLTGDNYCSIDNVKKNLSYFDYKSEKTHYIKGDVMTTLNDKRHKKISLLRLDTDFYESTYHELKVLHKNVIKNGFIIYDDYGHWRGQFEAVNLFHKKSGTNPLMIRTSRKERLEIKL